MAGVLQIHEMTDTDTGVDKTSGTVRFKSADETNTGTTNKLTITDGAEDFSYTKQLRAYVETVPSVVFENLIAYTDGDGFADAALTVEYDVDETWAANVDTDIAGTDLFTKVDTDAISLDTSDTEHLNGDGQGYWGEHLRLQLGILSTADPGTLTAETLTFAYDET
jgi:hypothetical protein